MKRHRADFESEADEQQQRPGDEIQRPIGRLLDEVSGDLVQVRGAGGAIDQRDAIEEKTGGEGAHEKIFHGGLARLTARAPQSRQHVNRNGHGFESQEKNNQIIGRRHENHPHGGKKNQFIELTLVDFRLPDIVNRRENRKRRDAEKDLREEKREIIQEQGIAKGALLATPKKHGLPCAKRQSEQTGPRQQTFFRFLDKEIKQHDDQGRQQHLGSGEKRY